MLGLQRGFRKPDPLELLRIFLISCNPQGVCADVGFKVFSEASETSLEFERTNEEV